MSYHKKKTSNPLQKLKFRIQALKSVDPDFDFGNGMEVNELEQFESELEDTINGYNNTLSDADDLRDSVRDLERRARDISERLLALATANYGRDSLEYQRLGGTRKSEIQWTGSRPETYDGEEDADETSANSDTGTGDNTAT